MGECSKVEGNGLGDWGSYGCMCFFYILARFDSEISDMKKPILMSMRDGEMGECSNVEGNGVGELWMNVFSMFHILA